MNIKLKKLNEDGYRDYQRCIRKIEYSIFKKGEPNFYEKQISKKTDFAILTKPEFLEEVANPDIAIYCLKDAKDNNIGITILSHKNRECKINEFAVFEKYNGIGTEFYKILINEIKELWPDTKELTCMCPFDGAQEFWKKMGFERKYIGFFEYWRRIPK